MEKYKNINESFLDLVDENFIDSYESLNKLSHKFVEEEDYIKKRQISVIIVEKILQLRGKRKAALTFGILEKMEINKVFKAKYRDHIIHTVNVFLLGYYIYKNQTTFRNNINTKIKEIMIEYEKLSNIRDDEEIENNFIYIWSLICLYHDYGYVFESNNFNIVSDNFMLILEDLKLPKTFSQKELNPEKIIGYLRQLEVNGAKVDAFNLISEISNRTNLAPSKLNGIANYNDMCLSEDRLDHGIMSALLFLKISNVIFIDKNHTNCKEYVWNENIQLTYFKCVAETISIHNIQKKKSDDTGIYSRYCLNLVDRVESTDNFYISLVKDPFAYLLVTCDEIQNWDRRRPINFECESDLPSKNVFVSISDDNIIEFKFQNATNINVVTETLNQKLIDFPKYITISNETTITVA